MSGNYPTVQEIQQSKLDMKDINTFVTGEGVVFQDNTGKPRLTLQGITEQAISSIGYIVIGNFSTGCTITTANQVVSDGVSLWRWGGVLPNVVSAGSSPTPSSPTAWTVVSDAAFKDSLANPLSIDLIAGVRAKHISFKNIFQKMSMAIGYTVSGDPSTWDWTPAIQSAMDEGGTWFFPPFGNGLTYYDITQPLQVRVNKNLSLVGPLTASPRVYLRCKEGSFAGKSLIRQWDQSWYAAGETNQDERPANLGSYTNLIDRYLNIHNLAFFVSEGVTAIDLVAMHESSQLSNLIFNGANGVNKGYAIRIRSGGGSEVSMNGCKIQNLTAYSNQWKGMIHATGAGSDLDIDTIVTMNAVCQNPPFLFDLIDVTMRNIHCETYCAGQPTVLHKGTDLRIDASFFSIRNGQGDLVKCENPFTSGYSRTGVSITQTRLYPEGGNDSNVTNRASIYIVNDISQLKTILIPMAFANEIPTMVVNANKAGYTLLRENKVFEQSFSDGVKTALYRHLVGNSDTAPVLAGTVITITHEGLKSMMVRINWQAGSVYQATGNDYFNNPQWGRIALGSSFNGSEFKQSAQIVTDKAPAIFGNPVWNRTLGTLQLTTLIDFTYGLFTIEYI